jgi:hypothetical protein
MRTALTPGGTSPIAAINLAIAFYGTNPPALAHGTYHVVPALPGQSSVAVAIEHLNRIAARTAVQDVS